MNKPLYLITKHSKYETIEFPADFDDDQTSEYRNMIYDAMDAAGFYWWPETGEIYSVDKDADEEQAREIFEEAAENAWQEIISR